VGIKKRGGQPVPYPKQQYATRLELATIAYLEMRKAKTGISAAKTIEQAVQNFKELQEADLGCPGKSKKAF